MKTPDTIERDINRIRRQIHAETKNMTPAQYLTRIHNNTLAASKKYGFKYVGFTNAGKSKTH